MDDNSNSSKKPHYFYVLLYSVQNMIFSVIKE